MFKYIIKSLLVLLLYSCNLAYAQKKESVLWEITGNGLKSKSYLFGTFHTVSVKLINRFPEIKAAINRCNVGIFEKSANSIGAVADAEIKTPPLDSVFTKKEYLLVDDFFSKSPFGSIRPHNNEASLLAMLQAIMMLNKEQTKNQSLFFDEYIQAYMIDSLSKKTFGLDEPIEMAESAKKTDYKSIAKLIIYLIESKADIDTLGGNAFFDEPLYIQSMQADMKRSEEVKVIGIKEGTVVRNQIWLPKIISKISEDSSFIAVGLGHLQYKTGLITLLRAHGYTLKPIHLKKY
ncbi:TraB/GumN family protein [Pedobacter nototheniae]|uniref:TraB/GumN family protein n=1 Tax=Pedobacter nototheniae TaxID=2488994 RepID=UPI002930BD18|nr:TraB/GumN family protein [Pedobacter nototheniae]